MNNCEHGGSPSTVRTLTGTFHCTICGMITLLRLAAAGKVYVKPIEVVGTAKTCRFPPLPLLREHIEKSRKQRDEGRQEQGDRQAAHFHNLKRPRREGIAHQLIALLECR